MDFFKSYYFITKNTKKHSNGIDLSYTSAPYSPDNLSTHIFFRSAILLNGTTVLEHHQYFCHLFLNTDSQE